MGLGVFCGYQNTRHKTDLEIIERTVQVLVSENLIDTKAANRWLKEEK